jgi:hypothetical protein
MQLSKPLWNTVLACNTVWMKFRGTKESDWRWKNHDLNLRGTNLCHAEETGGDGGCSLDSGDYLLHAS